MDGGDEDGLTGREVYIVELEVGVGWTVGGKGSFSRKSDAPPTSGPRWMQMCAHLPSLSKVVVAGGLNTFTQGATAGEEGSTQVWVCRTVCTFV